MTNIGSDQFSQLVGWLTGV